MRHTPAAVAACALSLTSLAQESHWINPAGGSFGDAANWQPAAVPGASTKVFFGPASTYTATLDAPRSLNGVVVAAGSPTLNLGGFRLTLTAPLAAHGEQFTLRNGELYFPPSAGSVSIAAGTTRFEADARVYQLGGFSTIAPGAALIHRGVWSWCGPSPLGCKSFTLRSDGHLRIEGGIMTTGSFQFTGLTEMIGGSISHDGGSSTGTLIMSGGARIGGHNTTGVMGPFHLASGAELYSFGQGVYVGGAGVFEGTGTRINGHYRIGQNAHVTVRTGAVLGVSSGALLDNAHLIVQAGGTLNGFLNFQGASRLRLEPGSAGPESLWFTSNSTTLEFLIDGANPSATPPRAGAASPEERTLRGDLTIDLINPNPLAVGQTIPLLQHPGGFTGAFNSITLPPLHGGRALAIANEPTRVVLRVVQAPPSCHSPDFDGDGSPATDADIEAFFACLAGNCCPTCPASADFNGDGDTGTDADIEAFFRVLAGGPC
jgi:hypothetical protein